MELPLDCAPDRSTSELIEPAERPPRRPPPSVVRDHATLTCVKGPMVGRIVGLGPDDSIALGRDPHVAVHVPEASVSRRHARIVGRDGEFHVRDLGSLTGTWIDGRRVEPHAPKTLTEPCRLQLGGSVSFRFDRHDGRGQRVLLQLHEASVRDPLTGAYNRRYLDERLEAEISYALRQRVPLAVVMLDIDHFKRVNDRHGHPVGDLVLVAMVEQIQRMIRPEDVFVRYGGEEFCVVLRNLDERNAEILAERIRRGVEQLAIPCPGQMVHVTLSAGVAALSGDRTATPASMLHAADAALYRAKTGGRNRVASAAPDARRTPV